MFLEVLNNAFQIGKVQINFLEYDVTKDKGERIKNEISVYVNIDKFLLLANDTLNGRINALSTKAREEQQKGNYKYCKEIWSDMGGRPSHVLKEKGEERPDGKSLSRQMKITPGDKVPWIISAESGPGELTETGLIVPRYTGNKPEVVVRVPMTNDDIKMMVLIVKANIEGYVSSQY
ncbi:hypothetical protein [Bacillus tuaregi]|uniref:hypothetical protein n=1 Tax=Bacillus tuaregi TaxID=1816695 RepID=UPI001F184F01|nr:hypothetical protein [Bacillus tuaregi]